MARAALGLDAESILAALKDLSDRQEETALQIYRAGSWRGEAQVLSWLDLHGHGDLSIAYRAERGDG